MPLVAAQPRRRYSLLFLRAARAGGRSCRTQNQNPPRGPMRKLLLAALLPILASMSVGQTDAASFAADLFRYNVETNIVYHTANNYQNKLDVYTPAEAVQPTPVVVVIHGGGWVAGT